MAAASPQGPNAMRSRSRPRPQTLLPSGRSEMLGNLDQMLSFGCASQLAWQLMWPGIASHVHGLSTGGFPDPAHVLGSMSMQKLLRQPRSKSLHDTACLGVLAQKSLYARIMMSDQWSLPVPWHRGSYPDFFSASFCLELCQAQRLLSNRLAPDVCDSHPCQQLAASVRPRPNDHPGHAYGSDDDSFDLSPDKPGLVSPKGCNLWNRSVVPQLPETSRSRWCIVTAAGRLEAAWTRFLKGLFKVSGKLERKYLRARRSPVPDALCRCHCICLRPPPCRRSPSEVKALHSDVLLQGALMAYQVTV